MERTKQIKFTIYGKPMAKKRPKFTGRGRAYTPKDTINYENLVRHEFRKAVKAGFAPFACPVALQIFAYFEIPKNTPKYKKALMESEKYPRDKYPDWDNIGKIISDSLNQVAFYDDKQVVLASVDKFYSKTPRVMVILTAVADNLTAPLANN